jgi:hypothetical protein
VLTLDRYIAPKHQKTLATLFANFKWHFPKNRTLASSRYLNPIFSKSIEAILLIFSEIVLWMSLHKLMDAFYTLIKIECSTPKLVLMSKILT